MYKMEEKIIKVRGKNNELLSPCTKKKALKMIRLKYAKWIDYNVIQLLINDKDRKELKIKVIENSKRYCYICGKLISLDEKPTIDHVIPKDKGGLDTIDNWKCCCRQCNNDKANRNLKEYINFIKLNRAKYDIISDEKLIELEKLANNLEAIIGEGLCTISCTH